MSLKFAWVVIATGGIHLILYTGDHLIKYSIVWKFMAQCSSYWA